MRSFERRNLCSFVVSSSRAHTANYWDGPMYNGYVGVVCPTHILDEKGVPSRYAPDSSSPNL